MKTISNSQRGVVIVVVLIMLLVMTGIGVTLMSGAIMQERVAGNNRQLSIARVNAEAALRQGELAIVAMNITNTANTPPHEVIATNFNPTGDGRFVDYDENITSTTSSISINSDPLADDLSDASNWTAANSVQAGATATSPRRPRFTIEYLGASSLGVNDVTDVNLNDDKANRAPRFPHMFRITAIGYGPSDGIYAVLQSIYSTGR